MTTARGCGQTSALAQTLFDLLRRPGPVLVLMQNNPDPDALASAAALRAIAWQAAKKSVTIGFGGVCGRAENRAMMKILKIDARPMRTEDLAGYETICLVDCQPRAGNNLLPMRRQATVVIDHHLSRKRAPWTAQFADVRPTYGATSTILYEYLRALDVPIDTQLATALFYGIQSDTQDLGREAGDADVDAYQSLFLLADKRRLARIHHAPVPRAYFAVLAQGLAKSVVAGPCVIGLLPTCPNPDTAAEVADLLMRLEGVRMAVCYGVYGDEIVLSARGATPRTNVANRVRRVVKGLGHGGGHLMMAAGRIPLEAVADGADRETALARVRDRILKAFAPNARPHPLVCEEKHE